MGIGADDMQTVQLSKQLKKAASRATVCSAADQSPARRSGLRYVCCRQ